MIRSVLYVIISLGALSAVEVQAVERSDNRVVLLNPAFAASSSPTPTLSHKPTTRSTNGLLQTEGRKIVRYLTEGVPASPSATIKLKISPSEIGVSFTKRW